METSRSVEYEEWQAACREERDAWANVSGRLPGSPEHDVDAWQHWQEALQKSTDALHRYSASRSELRSQIKRKLAQ